MAPVPVVESSESEEKKDIEGDEEAEEEEEAPSHLPLAPSPELYDISTTVDPSYVISLIRQLLPSDATAKKQSQKIENNVYSIQGSETFCQEQPITSDCNQRNQSMASEALEDLCSHRDSTGGSEDNVEYLFDQINTSTSDMDQEMNPEIKKEEPSSGSDYQQTGLLDVRDPWEDCGCILWDLAASKTHAEFMVNNLLLEVLLANLRVSKSLRVMEICLGIIGNLACHDVASNAIVSTNGLIETVVDQLFLDDSTCLTETFRVLATGLQGNGFSYWAEALLPEQILQRILWITGNTLNSMLLEKSIEFFLTITGNQVVASLLLQPLIKLGLPNIIVNLLACEVSKLGVENKLDRSSSLDPVLHLVEALTTIDSSPQAILPNEELFRLVCDLVKLPDKIEIASSCVSAVVIIANLLVDEEHLASEVLHDISFLHGVVDIFPFVSDDLQARNALWCILSRSLGQVQGNEISMLTLHQFASLFLEKSHLIEEDLEGHPIDNSGETPKSPSARKSYTTTISLRRIAQILEEWISRKSTISEKDIGGSDDDNDGKLLRLLDCCHKYGS